MKAADWRRVRAGRGESLVGERNFLPSAQDLSEVGKPVRLSLHTENYWGLDAVLMDTDLGAANAASHSFIEWMEVRNDFEIW